MNFYYQLRSKGAKRPTTIYAIITNEGKQYKVATEYKILPSQWDGKMAIVSPYNNAQTNDENLTLNENLHQLTTRFYKSFCNFATSNDITFEDIVTELKSTKVMGKRIQRYTTAQALLRQGFNALYLTKNGELKEDIKESTYNQYYATFKKIDDFLRANPQLNKPHKVGVELMDGIYNELIEEKLSKSRINSIIVLLRNIINNVLAVETEFSFYKIKAINKKYNITDNKKQEDKKSNALTQAQVNAIKSVELEGAENTARNIFMVEVLSGQRISDNQEVVNALKDGKKIKTIKTKKEGTKAIIINDDELNYYIGELVNDGNYNKIVNSTTLFNKLIKKVAEKANLNETITYTNKGQQITSTICKAISSHWGRHTFITLKLREGYSVDEVAKMSGHKSLKIVQEIYNHLTDEDNEEALLKVIEEKKKENMVNNTPNESKPNQEPNKAQIEELRKVLTMFNVNSVEWIEIDDYEELLRVVFNFENHIADKIGWSYKDIKDLFNSDISLKEKREVLQQALLEVHK